MNKMSSPLKIMLGVVALVAMGVAGAQAVPYPSKPVRVIVPFPAGGGIDVLVRALGNELSQKWGQPFVVENKPGASTFIGAELAARSPADGYTLLATTDPTFTSNRHLFKALPYDPDGGFEPVIQMVKGDNLVFAHPNVPFTDLQEMVAAAKKGRQHFSFGSYGNGTQPQLVFGYLNKREGVDLLHVPYKGIAPVMMGVASREVDLSVASPGVAGEMIKSGRVRPLAVAGDKRLPQFPNVKTTAEQGFPYLKSFIWYGLFAPKGTPPEIVNKLNAEIASILRSSAFAEQQVNSKGMTVMAGSPREFAAVIKQDTAFVGEMVKAANVKPE
ncbi:MAG: tripartite tricarboxylate transporter substrate binding protein [Burkholderiales bacterium]|nr:tripartite tricarboxylate transporter substrate binding protein [Burkholderiales bacterium]